MNGVLRAMIHVYRSDISRGSEIHETPRFVVTLTLRVISIGGPCLDIVRVALRDEEPKWRHEVRHYPVWATNSGTLVNRRYRVANAR